MKVTLRHGMADQVNCIGSKCKKVRESATNTFLI
jgi:hypothetical protein